MSPPSAPEPPPRGAASGPSPPTATESVVIRQTPVARCVGVAGAVVKASIRAETAYRGAFFARAGEGIASLLLSVGFYSLIYRQVGGIPGWSFANILTLAGSFEIIRGVVLALCIRNLPVLADRIRNGELDYDLVAPVNPRFLISCRRLLLMSLLPALLGV